MYIEEPRKRIDWGSLIKKGLVILAIAAIIFLIIWLFTRNDSNSNNINVDYDENNINNNINEVLTNPNSYSGIFINNYRYFHDTAKEYFQISELPTTGNSLKYTLQDLINKELILPFSYGDGTCDTEDSYVMVKNDNGEYTMTVTLICGSEVAKTTEELGCNQLCNNGTCTTPEEVEHQYKQPYKATETVYNCPSGYTKTGSGTNTKCVKGSSSTVNATKNVTYNCPSGYTKTGNGSSVKCIKNSSAIDATPKTTYSCSQGQLNGTKCTITSTSSVDATPKTTYSCSQGKLNGTKCTITSTSSVDATPKTTYSCSEGELINEKYCRISTTKSYYQSYTLYKGKTYNGCKYSGSYTDSCSSYSGCTRTYYKYYCNKSSYKEVDATPKTTYSCSEGTLNGTKCTITSTSSVNATPKTTYSCSEGTLNGTKCVLNTKDTISATKNTEYTCGEGYNKVGTGAAATCTKGSTTTTNPTKSTKSVTKYKYKWSSETSLDGWERTGKTRKVSSK